MKPTDGVCSNSVRAESAICSWCSLNHSHANSPTATMATSDHRLQRDRQHHAAVVFGGVDLAGAEQGGEQGHQQCHIQRRVGEDAAPGAAMPGQHFQAHRHRFVLQRQVRNDADQCDHRHQRGQPARTAVARGDEIGDGHGIFGARDQRQALDDAPAEQQQQQRAQIDRQVADAIAHRRANRAVKGPRRAIHRQRQAVDRRPQPRPLRIQRAAVAPPRHPEQQGCVTQGHQQQDPARDQHVLRRGAAPAVEFTQSRTSALQARHPGRAALPCGCIGMRVASCRAAQDLGGLHCAPPCRA